MFKPVMNRLPGGWIWNQIVYLYKLKKDIGTFMLFDPIIMMPMLLFMGSSKLKKIDMDHHYDKVETILKRRESKGNKYFQIKNIKIPYPERKEYSVFYHESRDLLVPYAIGEYDYIRWTSAIPGTWDEGPYEINKNVCITPGDIVIDVGANIGLFSAVASGKGAEKIYSFEPSSCIITQYLSKIAKLNDNIIIVNAALTDYNGSINFYYDTEDIGCSHIGTKETISEAENVAAETLDHFVERERLAHVDFIKADIEGAERSMLQGASEVLKKFAPKLSICTYHLADDPQVLKEIILNANPNYTIDQRESKLYAWVDPEMRSM